MSDVDMKQAQKVYNTIINMLDSRKCDYEKDDQDLTIKGVVYKGEEISFIYMFDIDPEVELVTLFSKLPISMPKGKRKDGAIAICVANYYMLDGSFDYDINSGEIMFRITTSFASGSILSKDVFEYMIVSSSSAIEEYYNPFFMLASGKLTIQQFIEQEKNK